MSLINGISALGAGLTSFASDAAKDETVRPGASLLNSAPAPVTPTAAVPSVESAPPIVPVADSAGHGNALDAATIDRAHRVFLGLTERGMDPTTAIGFAANAVQESRANPQTGAGDMGASHGLLQWRGDRLANYIAANGHAPEQGNLGEQLDYIMHEISGPEAGAWKSILASNQDPAARAAAVSQFYERPKDTQAEIARRGYIAGQLANHFAQIAANGGASA